MLPADCDRQKQHAFSRLGKNSNSVQATEIIAKLLIYNMHRELRYIRVLKGKKAGEQMEEISGLKPRGRWREEGLLTAAPSQPSTV